MTSASPSLLTTVAQVEQAVVQGKVSTDLHVTEPDRAATAAALTALRQRIEAAG